MLPMLNDYKIKMYDFREKKKVVGITFEFYGKIFENVMYFVHVICRNVLESGLRAMIIFDVF